AQRLGMTIIPFGKCDFARRVISGYRPHAIVGSVFKLLRLARRLEKEGLDPKKSSITRLIAGGESFADESRAWLATVWGCPVYNTYGSTEGTMCGECTSLTGLHVPEDLVHLDIYDPLMQAFVHDGDCGRAVLTTLLPEGAKAGMLLLNYDTEDTTSIVSRKTCACGRTHMRIVNPQREAETFWIFGTPFNRVDIEASVFQSANMEHLTGEYEAFIHDGKSTGDIELRVSLECLDPATADQRLIEERFTERFLRYKKVLAEHHADGMLAITFSFLPTGELELYRQKGRPKRLTERRMAS
ncbi:MAG: coenzyme F390 synthetase, partial [Methanomicrobiales archaeon]|nr:coenzyme F390 synthetase [Methanomicrobiales archaeon]